MISSFHSVQVVVISAVMTMDRPQITTSTSAKGRYHVQPQPQRAEGSEVAQGAHGAQ